MNWDDYFIYNLETGKLFWRERGDIHPSRIKQWNACNAGKEVGALGSGGRYLETALTVKGKRYNLKAMRCIMARYLKEWKLITLTT